MVPNPKGVIMDPWNNAEKNKVVAIAGDLIVNKGWDEDQPLNALYHAQFKALPDERCAPSRTLLVEASGRTEEAICKSVAAKVKKLRKAAAA
jgi:hypothetical protein